MALDALREAVSKRRSLTDDEAAALVAEKARQKRIEKRAHDTET